MWCVAFIWVLRILGCKTAQDLTIFLLTFSSRVLFLEINKPKYLRLTAQTNVSDLTIRKCNSNVSLVQKVQYGIEDSQTGADFSHHRVLGGPSETKSHIFKKRHNSPKATWIGPLNCSKYKISSGCDCSIRIIHKYELTMLAELSSLTQWIFLTADEPF